MQEVYKAIGRVAASDVSVLLRGESGTGKEVGRARCTTTAAARGGRSWASRPRPFRPTMLESELFGHERGLIHRRQGAPARQARAGPTAATVFFDEIGDMPAELQGGPMVLLSASSGSLSWSQTIRNKLPITLD